MRTIMDEPLDISQKRKIAVVEPWQFEISIYYWFLTRNLKNTLFDKQ